MREKAEKPAKRKLTRAERKQIEAVIRQAKGDGKIHTVQDSIPFQNMFPDGLCRLEGGAFSKTIAFEDVNYRLAGPEDQRSIFESLCDFYNGYDPSIGVQASLDSRSGGSAADEMFGITRQGNDLDPIRDEAVDILRMQYKRGNNGYVKTKYVTLTIEAENLPAARARFARIETDTLNRFKVMGAAADALRSERLLHRHRKFQNRGNLQCSPYSITHLHCIFHILSVECCYMLYYYILFFILISCTWASAMI